MNLHTLNEFSHAVYGCFKQAVMRSSTRWTR